MSTFLLAYPLLRGSYVGHVIGYIRRGGIGHK